MTLQDVKMTLQSHVLKAARILGCTAFCTYGGAPLTAPPLNTPLAIGPNQKFGLMTQFKQIFFSLFYLEFVSPLTYSRRRARPSSLL